MFLSFLMRERDRAVTIPWPWFRERFGPWSFTVWSFQTVHRSWPFLTVSWTFLNVLNRLRHSTGINDKKTSINAKERSWNGQNGHETVRTVDGQERWTPRSQKHLGTFKSERSNALERKVENGHGTVTLTYQKRKNYCMLNAVQIN